MRVKLGLSVTLLFAATVAIPAKADTYNFSFAGPGVSGNVSFTYGSVTDAKYTQAYAMTGISGTFTDTNHGLNILNAPVTGLVPINPATPEPDNLLAPHDFSRFAVATGLGPNNNGFLTYDNLFYPGGAPQTASSYPASGGLLDIYGLMFSLGNGDVVDIWSNGTFVPGGPVDYGVAVATSAAALDYVPGDVVPTPEPGGLCLLATGMVGALARRRYLLRA